MCFANEQGAHMKGHGSPMRAPCLASSGRSTPSAAGWSARWPRRSRRAAQHSNRGTCKRIHTGMHVLTWLTAYLAHQYRSRALERLQRTRVARTCARVHTHTHAHTHALSRTHAQARKDTQAHAGTRPHAPPRTHSRTHACTRMQQTAQSAARCSAASSAALYLTRLFAHPT